MPILFIQIIFFLKHFAKDYFSTGLPSSTKASVKTNLEPSRGGLVVERWSDNRLDSATVGSNLRLGMIYQSLSSWKAMSHIHMNAERRVPSGVYDKCPRR